MRNSIEQEGDIRGTDLLAGLVGLWREAASGSLQFSRSGSTAGFEIVRGELVASSSSDPRFETASILVRAGKLEAATLERLAAPEGGDRALLALQAGVLTRREWRWGEKIRAVEILSDLLTWLDGEYWFFRTTEAEVPESRLPIPRLILELFLRSRDRSLVLHYLGGVDVPIARAQTFDEEFATFGLTADAESVVRLIDGKSSAAEIASEAPAEPFAVEKLLAALVTLGLVHPEFGPGTVRPPPAPTAERAEDEGEAQERDEPDRGAESMGDEVEREEAAEKDEEEVELKRAADLDSALAEEKEPEDEEPDFRDAEMEGDVAAPAMTDASLDGGPLEDDFEMSAPEGDRQDRSRIDDFQSGPRQNAPSFERPLDSTTGIGSLERPRQRSGSPLLWTLGILAVLVAGLIWLRSRGPVAPESVAATIPQTATAAPGIVLTEEPVPAVVATAPSAQTSAPTSAPTVAPPTRPARTPAPRVEKPVRVRSPIPPPAAAAASAPASSGSRQYWLDRAARDAKRFGGGKKPYAVQLELACEVGSLVDAFQHDRGGNMWVVTTSFQGKTCFRVLWGHYATLEAGRRALSGAPAFFSTPKNHPAVTAVR